MSMHSDQGCSVNGRGLKGNISIADHGPVEFIAANDRMGGLRDYCLVFHPIAPSMLFPELVNWYNVDS